MKIQGCSEKPRHLFIGKGKKAGEEKVELLRSVVTGPCWSVYYGLSLVLSYLKLSYGLDEIHINSWLTSGTHFSLIAGPISTKLPQR
jgi:hypothetical protein